MLKEATIKLKSATSLEELQTFAKQYAGTPIFDEVKSIGTNIAKKLKGENQ